MLVLRWRFESVTTNFPIVHIFGEVGNCAQFCYVFLPGYTYRILLKSAHIWQIKSKKYVGTFVGARRRSPSRTETEQWFAVSSMTYKCLIISDIKKIKTFHVAPKIVKNFLRVKPGVPVPVDVVPVPNPYSRVQVDLHTKSTGNSRFETENPPAQQKIPENCRCLSLIIAVWATYQHALYSLHSLCSLWDVT